MNASLYSFYRSLWTISTWGVGYLYQYATSVMHHSDHLLSYHLGPLHSHSRNCRGFEICNLLDNYHVNAWIFLANSLHCMESTSTRVSRLHNSEALNDFDVDRDLRVILDALLCPDHGSYTLAIAWPYGGKWIKWNLSLEKYFIRILFFKNPLSLHGASDCTPSLHFSRNEHYTFVTSRLL